MNNMWKMYTGILLGCLSIVPLQAATLSAEEEEYLEAMEYLADLDFEQLQEVEVSLDDTFDIFDGLVRKRSTDVASGIKQSIERAPAVTSVITAQDIEAMGARTLEDALQTVPGLLVHYYYNNEERYNVRGIYASSNEGVLVLLNGIRINNARNGGKAPSWASFPVSQISRIEIIRGPGSAVYGADAFAGVVNIVSKTTQDIDGTEVGIRIGNNNTQDAWLVHGSQRHGFDITAMLNLENTDGHQRTIESDAQTVFDQMFGTEASLAPGPYGSEITGYDVRLDVAKQHWRFRTGLHKGNDMGTGAGIAQSLDPHTPEYEESINVDLTYSNAAFSKNWGVDAQLSYLSLEWGADLMVYPPGAFGGAYPIGFIGKPEGTELQTSFSLSGFYRGLNQHLIRVGIGYAEHDLYEVKELRNFGVNPFTGENISPTEFVQVGDTSAISTPESYRNNGYVFIQDTWTINSQWELTSGVRYDNYSDFGSTINPRIGLVWEPHTDWIVKLLYGRAFRAPGFQELYQQNNPVSLGNPNLDPEKIETMEVAFDYRVTSSLHLALNVFNYELEDKIILIPQDGNTFSYANAASWKGKGAEFEMRWKTSSRSSLLFNYSYQNSEDDNGDSLPYGSQQVAYLRGDLLLGSLWYVDGQVNWVGDRSREPSDPRPDLSGYTTVDLMLRRKDIRAGQSNFAIGVRNVFDEDIRYPSPSPSGGSTDVNIPNDLPGAGRFYFVEYRYKF